MNKKNRPSSADAKVVEATVRAFVGSRHNFENFADNLTSVLSRAPELSGYIHFIKARVKDPEHLRGKLERKAFERRDAISRGLKKIPAAITPDNVFKLIHDLAGIRMIHLHTNQMEHIHPALLAIFEEEEYKLVEPPTASCWDPEYRAFYAKMGIRTRDTVGYSSIHYVLRANTKSRIACELQVRTLSDEIWGEVSHLVNYPAPSPSDLCRKQLATLARLTTGCTRLVDSIFEIHQEAAKDRDDA